MVRDREFFSANHHPAKAEITELKSWNYGACAQVGPNKRESNGPTAFMSLTPRFSRM
jgi:hypothetical protein